MVAALSASGDIEVVGEAAHGGQAVARAAELAPDVVLIDIHMPQVPGADAIRQIRRALPATEVLVLTAGDDGSDLYEALAAGANGYLLKEAGVDEVAQAVRALAGHQAVIARSMTTKLVDEFRSLARRAGQRDDERGPGLTDREMQVLRLVAQSRTNREIAVALTISENTVKNHVRNILEKLHLHSRMEAVTYGWRRHLLDPPEQG